MTQTPKGPHWRASALWLPGGITIAQRWEYDGLWQALRWVGGRAITIAEAPTVEEVWAKVRGGGTLPERH